MAHDEDALPTAVTYHADLPSHQLIVKIALAAATWTSTTSWSERGAVVHSRSNCLVLCTTHPRLLHEGKLTISGNAETELSFCDEDRAPMELAAIAPASHSCGTEQSKPLRADSTSTPASLATQGGSRDVSSNLSTSSPTTRFERFSDGVGGDVAAASHHAAAAGRWTLGRAKRVDGQRCGRRSDVPRARRPRPSGKIWVWPRVSVVRRYHSAGATGMGDGQTRAGDRQLTRAVGLPGAGDPLANTACRRRGGRPAFEESGLAFRSG